MSENLITLFPKKHFLAMLEHARDLDKRDYHSDGFDELLKVFPDLKSRAVIQAVPTVALEDPLIGLKENVIIGRLIPTSAERARMGEVEVAKLE